MTSSRCAPVPRPLGLLAEPLYRLAIALRNRAFDAGRGVVRFDRVVISVGNLSVGGTGKTPMVSTIVRWLVEAGHHPIIAMRGYAADADGESDEAAAYHRRFPDVPIVAQANRTTGLIRHFGREYQAEAAALEEREATHGPTETASQREVDEYLERAGIHRTDCIVLDDGFQHRQIARDLDIVLIDATRNPFHDRLLPAGWLREPVRSLRRAHALVLTHAESALAADVTALDRAIAQVRGPERGSAEAVARHDWAGLTVLEGGDEQEQPCAWLVGKRVMAVCAIGNPEVFMAQVQRATGSVLAAQVALRDHDPYAPGTVRRIVEQARAAGAQTIVTTEKDWSKLMRTPAADWPCPVARVHLEMHFDRGGEMLRQRVLDVVAAGAPE